MNNEQQSNNTQNNEQSFETPIVGFNFVRTLRVPTSTRPPLFPTDFDKKDPNYNPYKNFKPKSQKP